MSHSLPLINDLAIMNYEQYYFFYFLCFAYENTIVHCLLIQVHSASINVNRFKKWINKLVNIKMTSDRLICD